MSLPEIFHLLKDHIRLVIILPLLCCIVMAAYAYLVLKDVYTASTSMYVLAQASDIPATNLSTDLSASQMISNDVAILLGSDRVLEETASDLGLESLAAYDTTIDSETTSRVITLSVSGPNPQTAANVANAMVRNVSEIAQEVMDVESVNAIDRAMPPSSPSGPSRPLYVVVAFVGGLFLDMAILLIGEMLNTKVRGDDEVEELLHIPVIGHVPVMGGN